MKGKIMAFGIMFLLMVGLVSAVTSGPISVVYGQVTNSNGTPAANAKVMVKCDHNNVLASKTVYTNAQGYYQAMFMRSQCTVGDTVYVIARTNTYFGTKLGTIVYDAGCKINLAKLDVKLTVKI